MNIQAIVFLVFLFASSAIMIYLIARLSLSNKEFDREIGRTLKSLGDLSRSLKTDTIATLSPDGKIPASNTPMAETKGILIRKQALNSQVYHTKGHVCRNKRHRGEQTMLRKIVYTKKP
jgi:hypothetical protein